MGDRIPINIYDDFASDFLSLGDKGQAEAEAVLRVLQVNPYDRNIQQKSFLHGETFEYPLDGGYSIFWKVHHSSIFRMEVLILAIERRNR